MADLASRGATFGGGGRSGAWATALLAPLCAALAAVVVFELTGGLPIAPQVTAAPPPSPALDWSHEPTVFDPPAREELDIIAARPLFSKSRRPFVAARTEEALPEPAEPLAPLELIGVLLTDQQRTVLVRPLGGGDPGWVHEDETVAGWRIERIERNRVHLRAGDRLEIVELRADTAVPSDTRANRRRVREQERGEARDQEPTRTTEPDTSLEPDEAEGEAGD